MARTYMRDVLSDFLRAQGLEPRVEVTGKHDKVRFEAGGQRLTYHCSHSHISDCRAQQNALADVRRMLRSAGVLLR